MIAEISALVILLLSRLLYGASLKSRPVQFCLLLSAAGLVLLAWTAGSLAIGFVALVLALSHARALAGRYGLRRTRRILIRSWRLVLAGGLVLIGADWLLSERPRWLVDLVGIIWLAIAVRALGLSLYRVLRYRYRLDERDDTELPSVTLAIPARNETPVLTDCLRSAVALDYPKLEVLVLDDCSQDSTPDIIRSFAHDGVRFIRGQAPASGWIGKNQAYSYLLKEASGDIVVFAGVDARFEPDSIRRLVHRLKSKEAVMVSAMPFRRRLDQLPNVIRPLRYYSQLALSRWPLMNSVWVVDRDWLLATGGFEPYSREILPERSLARLARAAGGYDFVISTPALGITSRKRAGSLIETALRTAYPLSGKEPGVAIVRSAGWTMALGLLIAGWWGPPVFAISAAAFGLSYFLSESALQPRGWLLSGWFLPLAILSESVLGLASMVSYEFGRVDWKGRNICLPIMSQSRGAAVSPPTSQPSSET